MPTENEQKIVLQLDSPEDEFLIQYARDFGDLAHSFVLHLRKIRYIIEHDDGIWEVDFFKDRNENNYFVMAEHEMPELQLKPKSIPDIISDWMLHEVRPFDADYGSNRLCDMRHAAQILETLTNEEKA